MRYADLSSNVLNQLLEVLKVKANVFHNGQYCGAWAIDTSGSNLMNFHVVTKGRCLIDVEGQTTTLSVGDAVFMPRDVQHSIRPTPECNANANEAVSYSMTEQLGDESTGLVCGNFTHQHPVFDRLLGQLPEVIVVKKQQSTTASKIIELILNESMSSGQSTNFLLNRLSDSLFYVLVRDNIDTHHGVLAAMSDPKLAKSLEFIHGHIDQTLTVDLIADNAGMSRSAFSALFKKIVQLTPAEYIIQWRMTQAYRWLVDDGISTYEAALRCSYESEASFSKAFKRVLGVGPGEARQINKNKE